MRKRYLDRSRAVARVQQRRRKPRNVRPSSKSRWGRRLSLTLKVVIYSGLVFIFSSVNFFGFKEYSASHSQDFVIGVLLGSVHAWKAGRSNPGIWSPFERDNIGSCDGRGGADCVAVVLLSESSLKHFGVTIPIPYEIHGRILHKILSYAPKAVFVDFMFLENRQEDSYNRKFPPGYFQKTMRDYSESDTRLYFLGNNQNPENPISFALFDGILDHELDPTPSEINSGSPKANSGSNDFGAREISKVNLTWAPLNLDYGVARSYDSHISIASRDNNDPRNFTAAFRVWRDICLDENSACECSWDNGTEKTTMNLIFGTPVHPTNAKWMRVPKADSNKPAACKPLFGILSRILYALGNDDRLWPDCPYIGEVPAEALDQPHDPDIEELIKGKIVVYGARLDGFGDVYPTPTHGFQPGARIHAVALDNLFLYGAKHFKRSPADTPSGWISFDLRELALILVIVFALALVLDKKVSKIRSKNATTTGRICNMAKKLAILTPILLAIYIILLICNFISYEYLNLAPINWVGIMFSFTIASMIYGVGIEEFSVQAANELIHKVSIGFINTGR